MVEEGLQKTKTKTVLLYNGMVGRNILLSWFLTTEVEHILLLEIIAQGCLNSSYVVIQFPETFMVIQDENASLRENIHMYLLLFLFISYLIYLNNYFMDNK